MLGCCHSLGWRCHSSLKSSSQDTAWGTHSIPFIAVATEPHARLLCLQALTADYNHSYTICDHHSQASVLHTVPLLQLYVPVILLHKKALFTDPAAYS